MLDFPNAPTIGDLFTSGPQAWRWDGTKWAVGSQGAPITKGDGVNILRRNGGFEIGQRSTGGSGNAQFDCPALTQLYTLDGWYLNAGTNQHCIVYQAAPGLTDGSQFCTNVQRYPGATGVAVMYFGFPLDTDELWPMLGKYVRLSFVTKSGPNFSAAGGLLTARLMVGTGTPIKFASTYTASTTVITTTVGLTATAVQFQANSSIVVPLNTRQAEVVFTWTPVGTAGADDSFFLDDVQLEIVPAATGYVASPFQRLNFEEQLALCQRHYQKTFHYNVAPANGVGLQTGELYWMAGTGPSLPSTGIWRVLVPFRVIPTISAIYNPSGGVVGQARNESLSTDCSSTFVAAADRHSIAIASTTPLSTGAGNLLGLHAMLDAGI